MMYRIVKGRQKTRVSIHPEAFPALLPDKGQGTIDIIMCGAKPPRYSVYIIMQKKGVGSTMAGYLHS
jgi:hypothetical protein